MEYLTFLSLAILFSKMAYDRYHKKAFERTLRIKGHSIGAPLNSLSKEPHPENRYGKIRDIPFIYDKDECRLYLGKIVSVSLYYNSIPETRPYAPAEEALYKDASTILNFCDEPEQIFVANPSDLLYLTPAVIATLKAHNIVIRGTTWHLNKAQGEKTLQAALELIEHFKSPAGATTKTWLDADEKNMERGLKILSNYCSDDPWVIETAKKYKDSSYVKIQLWLLQLLKGGDPKAISTFLKAPQTDTLPLITALQNLAQDAPFKPASIEILKEVFETEISKESPRNHLYSIGRALIKSCDDGLERFLISARMAGYPKPQTAIAEALIGETGEETEAILIPLLNSNDPEVVFMAARALASSGGRQAMEKLYPLNDDRLIKSPLAKEVEKTMNSIRSRLGKKEAGMLSIQASGELEGALSESNQTGQLSLSE